MTTPNTQTPSAPANPPHQSNPPAANPPADPGTQAPEAASDDGNKKPVSSFVKRLTQTSTIKPVSEDEPIADDRPLHIRLAELEAKRAAEAEAAKNGKPDGDPNATPSDPGAPAADPNAPAAPEPTDQKPKRSRLIKIEPTQTPAPSSQQAPQPAPQPQPAPAPGAPASEKDPYEGLSADQKYWLQRLEFAESNYGDRYKGKAAELRNYYAEEAKWDEKNPDATDSEREEFIRDHMPRMPDHEIRQIETDMIISEAERRAEERLRPKISKLEEDLENERRQQKLLPAIEKTVQQFEESMLDSEAEVPGGFEPYFAEMAGDIRKKGMNKAVEDHPIIGPIYASHVDAAKTYLEIINGVKKFDPTNGLHKWLGDFQNDQERWIMSDPNLSKQDGRTYMPLAEWNQLAASDPSKLANHFTITPENMLNAMMVHAHQGVKMEYDRLERAGFKRAGLGNSQQAPAAPEPAPNPPPPAPQPAPAPAAPAPRPTSTPPRAGGNPQPGLAKNTPPTKQKGLFSTMVTGV